MTNKNALAAAVALAMGVSLTPMMASAALVNGSNLSFTAAASGTTQPAIGAGSWFSMAVSANTTAYTGIQSFNGLTLGTTQLATGSHSGLPGCTPNSACNASLPLNEQPNIDNAWGFFSNTGMHQTTSNSNVISAAGNTGNVDMSGWSVTWNGIADIPMSGGSYGNSNLFSNGVGNVVCAVDCGNGDSYTLDYRATVPVGDPSGFGGVKYALHLEGTVSVIPVPAAVWLFGSGLLGLVGVARRKKLSA
jgi:hypothetical protein